MRCLATLALAGFIALAPLGRAAAEPIGELGAAMAQLERARSEVEGRRAALEEQHQGEAREIARLKAAPPGVARDYRLGQLLAAAQQRAGELDRLAAEVRGRDQALLAARQRFVAACEQALAEPGLGEARRGELLRRRDEVSRRLPPSGDLRLARPTADPLDGPAELADKADQLKDSEDKLHREIERLGRQIDSLETKRRLRERAVAVEEDLFAESASGRRVARSGGTPGAAARGGAEAAPQEAPKAGGPGNAPTVGNDQTGGGRGGASPPLGGDPGFAAPGAAPGATATVTLRGVLDPAMLDELRRAEASADLDEKLRALRRGQASLKSLATELSARESALRQRARELRK